MQLEDSSRALSQEEWANRALLVPSLHRSMKRDRDDDDGNDENDESKTTTNNQPFPRVTLSWQNLHYAIPAASEGFGWRSVIPFSSRSTLTPRVHKHDIEEGRRRARTASEAEEELLLCGDSDVTGEPTQCVDEKKEEEEEKGMKKLLRGVEGIVYPGELCAIMGASGMPDCTYFLSLALCTVP
jgi:hypothetical protein